MLKEYVAVLDSGIGGLNVLDKLVFEFSSQNFIYFGDNFNAPYGNRTKDDLFNLAVRNIISLQRYNLKAVILACNTLSVNVISNLKDRFNIPIIGIFPPVESQIMKEKKTLLLATDRTAERYVNLKNIKAIGLSNLVREIESNIFCLDRINLSYFLPCELNSYDSILLGCTHFIYLKNNILKFLTTENVLDGVDNTIQAASKYLKSKKSLDNSLRNKVLFFGDNESFNQKVWKKCFIK